MTEKITFDLGLVGFVETSKNEYTESSDPGSVYHDIYRETNWLPIPLPFLDFVYKF
jgi:hypothetical protein